ncbi:GntR family transcriptional regulator [Bosea sp. PAMC 26642]|uniref:GntR family transcriptional regulator n=1 Tax=Bosea sp. (strain PAMC 26642) TaxID=1792307 RepID=UPI00077048F7|nr:GntR family transcriptional regulator [Bosea sp. PAMC 26642]AMJ62938.1 hypothetical protein AXW83_23910 [Bosea sp. PAMC 26642]
MIRYQEIAESLERGLAAGGAGARAVPSEHELCERYRASRTTIRSALKQLQERGLIERRQGQGTFYRPRHIAKHLGSLVDFHTEARMAGRVPTTRVVSLVARPTATDEAALFGPAAAAGLVDLTRLRSLDDEPAVLQRSRLGLATLGRATTADLENASLYRYLAECRGVHVAIVEETLEPWAVSAEEASPLAIAPGTAVFRSQRVARDAAGAVVEVSDNLIRGDIYRFTIHRDVSDVAMGATS